MVSVLAFSGALLRSWYEIKHNTVSYKEEEEKLMFSSEMGEKGIGIQMKIKPILFHRTMLGIAMPQILILIFFISCGCMKATFHCYLRCNILIQE